MAGVAKARVYTMPFLAAEVRSAGVDVTVVHPSPMATNFFHNAGKVPVLHGTLMHEA